MPLESVHHWPIHFVMPDLEELGGDVWGGFAAMLVALPSSVAFGVAIYSIFGPQFAAQGAIAGVIGAAVLGFVAPALGGAPRLVSAPCAPGAAMMTALAAGLIVKNAPHALQPDDVLLILTVVALTAGFLQLIYGLAGGGQLIKYIPFPVISGYLTAVGLIIFIGQIPSFFGMSKGIGLLRGLENPGLWQWPDVIVGCATVAAVIIAPKITRALPAPIWGLAGGMAAYLVLSLLYPDYFSRNGERMVIGAIGGGVTMVRSLVVNRWLAIAHFRAADLAPVLIQPLILSILLSIDTLKTCVVVDTLTRSRHNSNRELIGQGVANSLCALAGGIPGSGVAGATLVNVNSGARSRLSSMLEGVFVAGAFLVFGRAIGRIPIAALSGILIVIAARMIDLNSFTLIRQKSTVLDFLVSVTVILVALRFDLITAAGAGLALSIILFIREQVRGAVIRRKLHGDQISSKQHRLPAEKELLKKNGKLLTVCQIQGSLFFGTTDQLLRDIETGLKTTRYLILDMARVQSVDYTAVHMLHQIADILEDNKGQLVFASIPLNLPTGKNLDRYFRQLDLIAPTEPVKVFGTLDEALEWAEDRVLADIHATRLQDDRPLELGETDLFHEIDRETLAILERCSTRRSYAKDETIFSAGDAGDELFLIRKGLIRISLHLRDGRHYNVTTFARGDFFGDMAFLDRGKRSADAIAVTPTDVFAISRSRFNEVVRERPALGTIVFAVLARALSVRLRYADTELSALQEL